MGSARPRVENIRSGPVAFCSKTLLCRNWHLLGRIMLFRAHNPVPGSDHIVVDFDLIYLGDADIQVEGNHEVC